MEKLESFLNKYSLLILLVLMVPAVAALLVPGFYGASDEVHIGWLYEMDRLVRSFKFPPRFAPDLSYGFGYPLFNFVFPLPFYLAEIFHLIGFSLVDSIKFLFLLSVPVSAIFMFLLLREYTNKHLSLLGAVLYAYGPYRAVDIYIRGAIGEILAFVFLPLIILSVKKIIDGNKRRWIGVGVLSFAGLVLSHNIATYMFVPFVVLFAGINLFLNRFKNLVPILMMFIGGLLVSIYFWLPALLESNLVKYDTVFNFIDHFPTLRQLVTPYWGYGASVPGPYDWMSFFMGFTPIFILLAGFLGGVFFWKKFDVTEKALLVWVFISLIIVFFMMNFRSTFLWENLPFIPYFQFPWRFLMMTTFLIPLLVIVLGKLKLNLLLSLVLIVVTILVNQSYFKPQDFLGRTDEYFLSKYVPYPDVDFAYTQNQEEYLRLPKDTQTRPDKLYPVAYGDNLEIKNFKQTNSLDSTFEVVATKSGLINYSKYNFPGWEAKVDGKKAEILTGEPFGQISLNIPEGEHQVKIEFKETPFKNLLNSLSLLAFIVSLLFVIKPGLKIKR